MIFHNNQYCEPEQPEKQALYICPECGVYYREPGIVRRYYFADGEVRKQCSYCGFHEDEVIAYSTAHEPDDFDIIEPEY